MQIKHNTPQNNQIQQNHQNTQECSPTHLHIKGSNFPHNNTDKKVGVVIPIYNVAPYLRECLDSVKNQTYTNLSIVLVNDGSTDNNESLNIAKEYVALDSRFILIDKENGGLSSARNAGITWFQNHYETKLENAVQVEPNTLTSLDNNANNTINATMGGGGQPLSL